MKSDFVPSPFFAVAAAGRLNRAGARRRALERNPFLEPHPAVLVETDQPRDEWRARARRFLRHCYREAKDRLGEDEARKLFADGVPQKKRGRKKGETGRPGLLANLGEMLLTAYDERARDVPDLDIGRIPAQLAKDLYNDGQGSSYGSSPEAIARHIRRLLTERKQRRAKDAEQYQRWADAYRRHTGEGLPVALLSPPDDVDTKSPNK
jgi:hypothetical protein